MRGLPLRACILSLALVTSACSSGPSTEDEDAECRVSSFADGGLHVLRLGDSIKFSIPEADGELRETGEVSVDSARRNGALLSVFDSSPRGVAIVGPQIGVLAVRVDSGERIESEPVCNLEGVGPVFVLNGDFRDGLDVDVIGPEGEAVAEFHGIDQSRVGGFVGER